jgi:NADH-quinone oxidoreductase subunit K
MTGITMQSGLVLAAILFALGLTGVLLRRNVIYILLSIEIMLNACGLAFIVVGSAMQQPDGQAMYFFILAIVAGELAIGLGLVLKMFHKFKTLDANSLSQMKG